MYGNAGAVYRRRCTDKESVPSACLVIVERS